MMFKCLWRQYVKKGAILICASFREKYALLQISVMYIYIYIYTVYLTEIYIYIYIIYSLGVLLDYLSLNIKHIHFYQQLNKSEVRGEMATSQTTHIHTYYQTFTYSTA